MKPAAPQNEIRQALAGHKRVFYAVGLFSAVINLLYLAPSLYMLQVYDRVLASRSETTLLVLSLLVVGVYLLMGLIDMVRSQVLVRVGNQLDLALAPRVFNAAFERNLRFRAGAAGAAMSDMTHVRQFITGTGVFAFFDAPWVPIYIAVVWVLHPALGMLTLLGVVLLALLAWVNEVITRQPLERANKAAQRGVAFATSSLRNAEVIEAMGMLPALRQRWQAVQAHLLADQSHASDRAGLVGALSKTLRLILQSAALGVGALLVLENELSPGAMIAGSILLGRATTPMDQLIGAWKPFVAARQAYGRLAELLQQFPVREQQMSLPRPAGNLSVEGVMAAPPGANVPVLRNVSLSLPAGQVLVVVGPSASGKSTLARLLVGVWGAAQGKVRLDGADLFAWSKEELGPHIGYLPQDVELFAGTIAENIARFGDIDSERVIEAARKAGLHDMILRFPKGYDSPIGEGGSVLSGGQRQRIGLARALYGSPALVVLDEPNASLDDIGERALVHAIQQLKREGVSVVLITHRTNIIAVADQMLVLKDGQVALSGPTQQVLDALSGQSRPKLPEEASI
ncbi:type I secretion system permease/ATPase [Perlucidibaca piscinae]|uniref:type I secretion system permease/ATPase n=1 Tax=Perlucidibaca piscinae TaxID=392589 RepID=UPI0003B51CF6|nr:type I secretion system permease/ATPase [Perlucidibaca piscinae]